jgi:hypothetical protein
MQSGKEKDTPVERQRLQEKEKLKSATANQVLGAQR